MKFGSRSRVLFCCSLLQERMKERMKEPMKIFARDSLGHLRSYLAFQARK